MKVILLAEVKGKGGEGDVVDVAPGFANNYLFRNGLAQKATKGNLKQLEARRHNIAAREEKRIASANATKEALEALTVKVEARVGEEGVLFGSVTANMIAEAIAAQSEIEVDRRRIDLKKPIKTAGTHEVTVSLYRDIKANLALIVGDETTFAAPAEGEEATEEAEPEVAAEQEAPAEPAEEAAEAPEASAEEAE